MAALIIEIQNRHDHRFYKVTKSTLRVGRALDNDIIIADPSVSPYHFNLQQREDGRYELRSLADENGIRVRGKQVNDTISLERLPLSFEAGRTRVRILEQSHPVAPTRLISCRNGSACIFGHWGWAVLLFAAFMVVSSLETYLSTPFMLTWESFGETLLTNTVGVIVLAAGLFVVNRLASHHWDFPASLSLVSLILIASILIEGVIPYVNYIFTTDLPGYAITLAWSIVLMPWIIGWFLIRLNHANVLAGAVVVIAVLVPNAFLNIKAVADRYNLLNDFSPAAFYSDDLVPWDHRLQDTISIDEFAETSLQNLKSSTKR